MKKTLTAVFKIREGEGLKVFQFVALFLLIQAGTAIGITTADALFLSSVGADRLPVVYILVPVAMLVYIPVNSFLTARLGIGRVFLMVLVALVIGGFVFWAALGQFQGLVPQWLVLYAAKIYAAVCFIALYSLLWNFAYQYFNILEGKRLFAFFTGGQAVGAIIGGVLINVLTKVITVADLFLVWSGLLLLALPFLIWIGRSHKIIETDEESEEGEKKSFLQQTATLARIVASSRYVLLLLLVMFTAQVLTTLLEFQYLDIFSRDRKEAELAALFGKLYIGVNLFNLFVSVFLFNRMVLRFGVRNIALILPIVYTVAFSWLFLDNGFTAGLFGFFAYQGLMVSVDYDNTNLLLNALPSQAKVQVRTFIEGLAEPLATASTGFFLLLFGAYLDMEIISLIGVCGAIAYLVSVLFLRHSYLGAMVTNLKRSWLDFSRHSDELVSDLDAEELALVSGEAAGSDPALVPLALHVLWLNDREAACETVLEQLSRPLTSGQRAEIEPLFKQLLKDDDAELFRKVVHWLERDNVSIDLNLMQAIGSTGLTQNKHLSRLLQTPAPGEQATAGLLLLKSWRLEDRAQGLSIFENLFDSDGVNASAAMGAIGKAGDERLAHFAAPYLKHPDPGIRRDAIESLHELVGRDSGRLLPALNDVIGSEESSSRLDALDALARIANTNCIIPMLRQADTFSPLERRRAVAVIEATGLRGVPMAVRVLRDRGFPYKGRSTAAHALSLLAFPQFEDLFPQLIMPELERAYRSLHRYAVLEEFGQNTAGLEVLRQLFLDVRLTIVDFVLELHSIAGRLPAFELLSASLSSNNSRDRGDAIETIEQGVSREVFAKLLPLIDSRPLDERINFYVANFSPPETSPRQILLDSMDSRHPLESAAAVQALWESGSQDCNEQIREKFRTTDSDDFKSTILSILDDQDRDLNLVERIHYLLRAKLFRSFGVLGLDLVARDAIEEWYAVGTHPFEGDERAGALICVVSGGIELGECCLVSGAVLGDEGIFGGDLGKSATVSTKTRALRINRSTIWNNADVYPQTALRLLEFSQSRMS